MFQIDLRNRKSIYQQVIDNLKEMILTGVLAPDDKLPSVRELSGILTVNPNTVMKAYKELESSGYVYTVQGIGTYVNVSLPAKIDEMLLIQGRELLSRAIREMSYAGLSKEEITGEFNNTISAFDRRNRDD